MVNDKIAGAHSELVIKVFGLHFSEMRRVANDIVKVLGRIQGAADVSVDQEPPLPQVRIDLGYAGALADRARALIALQRAAAIWDVDF